MKSKQQLEIVHSNVCEPFEVKSLGGNCYLLTFIDELTKYMWIYLIERKSDVFTRFTKFKMQVEKQVERTIKKLRTDVDVITFPLNL